MDLPPIVPIVEEGPGPFIVEHNHKRVELASFVLSLFVSSALIVASLTAIFYTQTNRLNESISVQQESQDITACREQLSSEVQGAQTDYLLAIGKGLAAFARNADTDLALREVEAAAVILKKATEARTRFELAPNGDCVEN